jgi:AcrR family transcriptional regulator
MPEAAGHSPRSDSAQATRQRILATAAEHFARHGYAGTSVRHIAREIGLTDPAIHYYFTTKQDLYEALLTPPDFAMFASASDASAREQALEAALYVFRWWAERPGFARMLFREQLANERSSVEFIEFAVTAWEDLVTSRMVRAFEEDGAELSETLMWMFCGVFTDGLLSFGDAAGEAMAQTYFTSRLQRLAEICLPATEDDGDGDA